MTSIALVALLIGSLLQTPALPGKPADDRRAEITRQAGQLLGEPYIAPAGMSIRFAEDAEFIKPVERAIYRYATNYVVTLVFADDGSLARVNLIPEALLYSNTWLDVPASAELTDHNKIWLLGIADKLRELGNQVPAEKSPAFCFQSGKNHYCVEPHEQGAVESYREDLQRGPQASWETVTRDVTVSYKRVVTGAIEDSGTTKSGEPLVRIGSNWYEVSQSLVADPNLADKLKPGNSVSLETTGCTGSEKACPAIVSTDHRTH